MNPTAVTATGSGARATAQPQDQPQEPCKHDVPRGSKHCKKCGAQIYLRTTKEKSMRETTQQKVDGTRQTAAETVQQAESVQEKETVQEAEKVRDDLCAALCALGIVLPSLAVDCAAYTHTNARALIELGRCNVLTARKLLRALEKARTSPA